MLKLDIVLLEQIITSPLVLVVYLVFSMTILVMFRVCLEVTLLQLVRRVGLCKMVQPLKPLMVSQIMTSAAS